MNITVRGDVDQRAVEQLTRCMEAAPESAAVGALLPDGHVGYSMPIGGVIGYREHVSPSGVGYDIGCGNKAVLTNLSYLDIKDDVPGIMDEIYRRISFGVGRTNNEPLDHPIFNKIDHDAPLPEIRKMLPKARSQLGTVGSGNHYVDLFHEEETDRVWVGVHFGSRGLGHAIASGFLAMARGMKFDDRVHEGEMDSPPTLLHVDSGLGYRYLIAMELAGDFASAGRDVVCDKVLEILGAQSTYEVHNHHNYTWLENHVVDGDLEPLWVVRKGCTPAFDGQAGFVGSTMGESSVVLEGKEGPFLGNEDLLYSTVHGAGRVMSRTQAAGKLGNRAECSARDCDYWVKWGVYQEERRKRGTPEHARLSVCPDHPDARMKKRRGRVADGVVDWDATRGTLRDKRVELRGGGPDEAPQAYKRLDNVLEHVSDTVVIKHRLWPIGVAMAGADTVDPWKD